MKWHWNVAFKQLRWRLISWLTWRHSEAMRQDYIDTRNIAWSNGFAFPDFALWLNERVFGDASGYRPAAKARKDKERILDNIQKIECECFENQAGYLNNFQPWHQMKHLMEQQAWTSP